MRTLALLALGVFGSHFAGSGWIDGCKFEARSNVPVEKFEFTELGPVTFCKKGALVYPRQGPSAPPAETITARPAKHRRIAWTQKQPRESPTIRCILYATPLSNTTSRLPELLQHDPRD